MFLIQFLLVLSVVIKGNFLTAVSKNGQCLTLENKIGACIRLTLCIPLHYLLRGGYGEIDALRKATCGFENLDPFVCCPQNLTETVSTSTPHSVPFDKLAEKLPSSCGSGLTSRILGGKDAALGSWPWIAALGYVEVTPNGISPTYFLCGGVLITCQHVLTAAHCLDTKLLPVVVRLGEHDLLTNPDCQTKDASQKPLCFESKDFAIAGQIIHSEWKRTSTKVDNDIGIIILEECVKFALNMQPICLDIFDKVERVNQPYVAGWGRINNDLNNQIGSNVLQQIQVPMHPLEKCQSASFYRKYTLSEKHLCAGGIQGQDSCSGDSGGPLMLSDKYGDKFYVIGIVSFGPTICGKLDVPGVYANVSHYHQWILENI